MYDESVPRMKRCSKCGEEKPASSYSSNKQKKDGLESWCRACIAIRDGRFGFSEKESLPAGLKRCSKCKELKNYDAFSGSSQAKDGKASRCKKCLQSPASANYPESPKGFRYCLKCGETKPMAEFKVSETKHYRTCKTCRSNERRSKYTKNREAVLEHQKTYHANNKEKANRKSSAWSAANPETRKVIAQRRRARKRNLPDTLTAAEWQYALNYFNGCCAVCDRPLKDLFGSHTAAADHWIPLSSPDCPGTVATNMIPLCHGEGGCNNRKRNKSPELWLIEQFGERKAKNILARIEAYFDEMK